jgi:lysozyme family protein/peptidoglycan hydrolase-like protein with peptidoglycan-binding domain
MIPTYVALEPTYAHELDILTVSDAEERIIIARVQKIMESADQYYRPVFEQTGIPIPVLAAINERESSTNFRTYLGNGDPLNRVTVHVPRNRGPWPNWSAGADDALHLDGLDQYKGQWTAELACYLTNRYNGFGPNAHGLPSGYVFAGSSVYQGGKYVADGVWSASARDAQLGCIPMILAIGHLHPDLALPRARPTATAAALMSAPPAPVAMANEDEVRALQVFLNILEPADGLLLDGNYGRKTRYCVQAFEQAHGFKDAVGVATEATIKAITREAALLPDAWKVPSIELAQALLNDFGAYPKLKVDGKAGPQTAAQLTAFQDTNNLDMTGTLTAETIAAMQDKLRRGV